ncbi:MAG: hypothetical protein ACD_22C00166G0009 [uncultured bacterium]|nr:MAG: hypothetical protein ACD_22C00166G0009 [uncultured bacterium]
MLDRIGELVRQFNNVNFSFTVLGISFTWVLYRLNQYLLRNSLLKTLSTELKWIGMWFGNKYDRNSHDRNWYHPSSMVIGLKNLIGIQTILSGNCINLFSTDLIKNLSYLYGGLNRFNQHVERHTTFVHADPSLYARACKELENISFSITTPRGYTVGIPDETLKSYIESSLNGKGPLPQDVAMFIDQVYKSNKWLHTDGIAGDIYYNEANEVPTPYLCYKLTSVSLTKENAYSALRYPGFHWIMDALVFFLVLLSLLGLFLGGAELPEFISYL